MRIPNPSFIDPQPARIWNLIYVSCSVKAIVARLPMSLFRLIPLLCANIFMRSCFSLGNRTVRVAILDIV